MEGGREGSLFGGRGLPDYSKGIHRHLERKAESTGAEGTACGGVAAEGSGWRRKWEAEDRIEERRWGWGS